MVTSNSFAGVLLISTFVTPVSYTHLIRNLSKGYRQRVGLAQALVGDPQLLILDEPTVGLDPAQIIEIRQLIRQLAKTRTVLLSSHILSEVQAVCDRIIILHQGHIVADASQEELTGQMGGQMQLQLEVEGNSKTVLETLRKIGGIAEVYRQEEKQYLLHLEEGCKSEADVYKRQPSTRRWKL